MISDAKPVRNRRWFTAFLERRTEKVKGKLWKKFPQQCRERPLWRSPGGNRALISNGFAIQRGTGQHPFPTRTEFCRRVQGLGVKGVGGGAPCLDLLLAFPH